jgi:hypothetical protein
MTMSENPYESPHVPPPEWHEKAFDEKTKLLLTLTVVCWFAVPAVILIILYVVYRWQVGP